jgi:hypothetical protein
VIPRSITEFRNARIKAFELEAPFPCAQGVEECKASENMKTRLVTRTGFFRHTVQYGQMRFHFRPGSGRNCLESFFSTRHRRRVKNDELTRPRGINGTGQNRALSVDMEGISGLPDLHFSPNKVDLISRELCAGASKSFHAGSPRSEYKQDAYATSRDRKSYSAARKILES